MFGSKFDALAMKGHLWNVGNGISGIKRFLGLRVFEAVSSGRVVIPD